MDQSLESSIAPVSRSAIEYTFNNQDSQEDLVRAERNPRDELSGRSNFTSTLSYVLESVDHPQVYVEDVESSSDESVKFEPIKLFVDGVEALSTPYDHIFANRSVLPIEILIDDTSKEVELPKKTCIFSFFKCVKIENQSQELREKLIEFGNTFFNCKVPLHGNLIMTWYFQITERKNFKLEPRIWQRLGFSSEDPLSNGLQSLGAPLVLLHLIFLKEKSPESMQKFMQTCLNPNGSECLFNISQAILRFSLNVAKSKKFSRFISTDQESPILNFLYFHSGIFILWCQCFEKASLKSDIQTIIKETSKKVLSINQVIDLFKSQIINVN